MMRRRVAAATAALVLALTGTACDNEDINDIEEGVDDISREVGEQVEKVGEEAQEIGNQVEEEIDKQLDTDGQDDK